MLLGQPESGGLLPSLFTWSSNNISDLGRLAVVTNDAHQFCEQAKAAERHAAQGAIYGAFHCGGYLRQAKKQLGHGKFTAWVHKTQKFGMQTAQMYMLFHTWALANSTRLIEAKPHSLRHAYILSGILRDDEGRTHTAAENDELNKVRRQVARLCREVAAHRSYADRPQLEKALEPLKRLLVDVFTDTRPEAK